MFTAAAKAGTEGKGVNAALKRCSTQNSIKSRVPQRLKALLDTMIFTVCGMPEGIPRYESAILVSNTNQLLKP
jgi:hypothetical protein